MLGAVINNLSGQGDSLEEAQEILAYPKQGIVLGCLRKGRLQPFPTSLYSPGEKVGRPGVYTRILQGE